MDVADSSPEIIAVSPVEPSLLEMFLSPKPVRTPRLSLTTPTSARPVRTPRVSLTTPTSAQRVKITTPVTPVSVVLQRLTPSQLRLAQRHEAPTQALSGFTPASPDPTPENSLDSVDNIIKLGKTNYIILWKHKVGRASVI